MILKLFSLAVVSSDPEEGDMRGLVTEYSQSLLLTPCIWLNKIYDVEKSLVPVMTQFEGERGPWAFRLHAVKRTWLASQRTRRSSQLG